MQYTLHKGPLTAAVDTQGGELVSFRDGAGTEYIWGGDPAYWAGRNPILFPIVGSLKNGRVDIGGKTCEMGRHGFARGRPVSFIPPPPPAPSRGARPVPSVCGVWLAQQMARGYA